LCSFKFVKACSIPFCRWNPFQSSYHSLCYSNSVSSHLGTLSTCRVLFPILSYVYLAQLPRNISVDHDPSILSSLWLGFGLVSHPIPSYSNLLKLFRRRRKRIADWIVEINTRWGFVPPEHHRRSLIARSSSRASRIDAFRALSNCLSEKSHRIARIRRLDFKIGSKVLV
jgi:hypothetical protein